MYSNFVSSPSPKFLIQAQPNKVKAKGPGLWARHHPKHGVVHYIQGHHYQRKVLRVWVITNSKSGSSYKLTEGLTVLVCSSINLMTRWVNAEAAPMEAAGWLSPVQADTGLCVLVSSTSLSRLCNYWLQSTLLSWSPARGVSGIHQGGHCTGGQLTKYLEANKCLVGCS